jgi:hypothetical protein
LIAQGIVEAAARVGREEGRRAAVETLERAGAARLEHDWLTQVAAARIAGVTPQTIREWLRAGVLGDPGRRGRVNLVRLREYLAGRPGEVVRPIERGREIAAAVLAAGGIER